MKQKKKNTGKIPSAESVPVKINMDHSSTKNINLLPMFDFSEIIIGLVGAVGIDLKRIQETLSEGLRQYSYETEIIHVSKDIICTLSNTNPASPRDYYKRTMDLMDMGNKLRETSQRSDILALGVAAKINQLRTSDDPNREKPQRKAYIINSLKHPDEVIKLREIYSAGFFLVGIYSDEQQRLSYLKDDQEVEEQKALELIQRDAEEHLRHGQQTRDTYYLSDFFVNFSSDQKHLKNGIWRFIDLIFGYPYHTPTFDEFGMFLAFSASLRSGDLSRQVGAVITKEEEILATGANEVPKYGGGQYWPSEKNSVIRDEENGRDYMRGYDANQREKEEIEKDILAKIDPLLQSSLMNAIHESRLNDITEYGRAVHAEMEAILSCARKGLSLKNAVLYSTTFPCHNCAKHIVGSGIIRVVYVEPYPKSKAVDLHDDSINLGFGKNGKVNFEPFFGVGPRKFFDLYSMSLGSGRRLIRKDHGKIIPWSKKNASVRTQLLPQSYLEREEFAKDSLNGILEGILK